jgi:bacillithiol biosynthesis cysteine-adding enzyme BshC
MEVKHLRRRRTNPLTQQYVEHSAQVCKWFDWHPSRAEHFEQRASQLDESAAPKADRHALVDALISYNTKHNNHPNALRKIEQLRDHETLVIVGGQQPGLLSGEMLVIYKALHVIQSAKQAEQRLNRPVVPVFWIAGDDHDWDEVDHSYLFNRDSGVSKIKLPIFERSRLPISMVNLTEIQVAEVLSQLEASLPDSSFKAEVLEVYHDCLRAGESLSSSFARLLGRFCGEQGLILLDAADPKIRSLEVPFFKALIHQSQSIQQQVVKRRNEIQNASFTPQVEIQATQANLFIVHEQERTLLHHDGQGGYTDRRQRTHWTKEELLALAEQTPAYLSNNVVTRPMMQEFLLPVLGCVLGPAELAYWAMYQPAFHEMGMQMPILLPRTEWTIVERDVQKQLNRYNLNIETALNREKLNDERDRWLKEQDVVGVSERFAEVEKQIAAIYQPLLNDLEPLPGIAQLGQSNFAKIKEQVAFLHKRAEEALALQHEVGLQRWDTLSDSLVPLGKPQERVYNVANYLGKYGFEWLHALIASADADYENHHLLYL